MNPGLKRRILSLEVELAALSGAQGAQPEPLSPDLERRNQDLAHELKGLENSLFLLLVDQLKPRLSDEALWKNIES